MSDECVKTHYSAQELADLSLPGIPSTRVGIAVKAKRDKWASRVREMKGGGVEYHIHSLPTETQKALCQRLAQQVLEDAQLPVVVEQKAVKNVAVRDELEVMVKCPELALREVQALTDKQKAIADARILLATEVHKLREYAGMT
ncbi:TPA: transposase, partial [Escherichia coli]|nr:transposase [Escherichia coli]